MTQHQLLNLVRQINPPTFSVKPHNADGHRIVYAKREAHLYQPSWLESLMGPRGGKQYFVARWRIPREETTWKFHWSEGTSAVSLDFDSRFVLQANEERQALRLVEALAETGEPGETLFSLINASLHQELERLLRECDRKAINLLDGFKRSSTGTGESEELNRKVSERLTEQLGGAHFRIGFTLTNVPPTQIEVRDDAPFTLADSDKKHFVATTALLQLSNYQAYKKSGLETEDAIRETLVKSIRRVAESQLFGRKYYDVVSSFDRRENSIKQKMHDRIEAEALTLGYELSMFQTFPDIAALDLLNPTRIDVPAEEEKYYLDNSTSYVQMSVSISVRIEQDFGKLHLLIDPDATDVEQPIKNQVKRICRDAIHEFDREKFNLNFQEIIQPRLEEKLIKGLGEYGLRTTVIHIIQAPTEDATRFMALRGRTVPFAVLVSPQANVGDADTVPFTGKVEVIGMKQNCWERFEGKDFGYRQDSRIPEGQMRRQAAELQVAVGELSPLPPDQRRALAIELELHEIRDRVISTLNETFSKVPNLAALWRTATNSAGIVERAQELVAKAIEDEFGLVTALRSVQRLSTDSENTAQLRRQSAHAMTRKRLELDVKREEELHQEADESALRELQTIGSKRVQILDDEAHERHQQVREEIESGLAKEVDVGRLTVEAATRLIQSAAPDPQARLPWLSGAGGDEQPPSVDGHSR